MPFFSRKEAPAPITPTKKKNETKQIKNKMLNFI